MPDVESKIQDSVVTGDVHVGDVHHNIQNTHVDQSTNVELPSLDEVGEKVSKVVKNVFDFVKGIINRAFLFATVIVLVCGFLIYNGNVDVNELIRDLK
jgi:predicted PurR-regulated permease PerM